MVYYHIPLPTVVGSALRMRIIHGAGYRSSESASWGSSEWVCMAFFTHSPTQGHLSCCWYFFFFVIQNNAKPIMPVCANVCISIECVSRSIAHSSTEGLQGWNHYHHNNVEVYLPSSLCLHLHPWWKAMTGHSMVKSSVNQNRYETMLVIFGSSPPGAAWVSLK